MPQKYIIAINLGRSFLRKFSYLQRVFARTVDFDYDIHFATFKTILLLFPFCRNWLYPGEYVIGVEELPFTFNLFCLLSCSFPTTQATAKTFFQPSLQTLDNVLDS